MINVTVALIGGGLAGVLFYGGLWWTVQRIQDARHPALLVGGSFLIRTLITMSILYGVMFLTDDLLYLGIALLCMLAVRLILGRRIKGETHATES